MPGFPVYHQLPKPTQTHVHRIIDAIQPSHPLLYPSPPAFHLSQHQGLFLDFSLQLISFVAEHSFEVLGLQSLQREGSVVAAGRL